MKLKQVTSHVGSQKATGKTWSYNPQPIDTNKVVYVRAEVYDNSPDSNAVFEPKRYRSAINFYYKQPQSLDDIKEPTYRVWSWMSDYSTFRNNKYKPSTDPHYNWYVNAVEQAKELHHGYSSDAVISHGCLGAVKNHNGGNGGYGPHNQPRYTCDVLHSLHDVEMMAMQLHIEDFNFDFQLNNVLQTKTKQGKKIRLFSEEFQV